MIEAETDNKPPYRIVIILAVIAALSVCGVMLLIPWRDLHMPERDAFLSGAADPFPVPSQKVQHVIVPPSDPVRTSIPASGGQISDTVSTTPQISSEPAETPQIAPTPLSSSPAEEVPEKTRLSFELSHVGPSGESLITGYAPKDRPIQLVVNSKVLATVDADNNGLFVLTLPAFETGGHDLELRALDHEGNVVSSAKALVILVKDSSSAQVEKHALQPHNTGNNGLAISPEGLGGALKTPPDTVTVFEGENLWNIAQRIYGTGSHYKALFSANKKNIRNPNRIFPGQILIIPQPDLPDTADPAN